MSHADCALYIGSSHNICEDYVIVNNRNNPTVALCDGCSSSSKTDIGARLLAITASKTMEELVNVASIYPSHVAENLKYNYKHLLDIYPNMFDATLISMKVTDEERKEVSYSVIGDGIIAVKYKYKDGIVIMNFDHQNYPHYLSYSWNGNEKEYLKLNIPKTKTYIFPSGGTLDLNYTECSTYDAAVLGVEWVAAFSDGVHSFKDENKQSIPMPEIINTFCDFKSFTGQFVQRRLNAFRKECAKKGWTWYDDISIGGITFIGEE